MVKKIPINVMKFIKIRERHIRWNWEISPEDSEKVRYHFVVVDDKDRKETMYKILIGLRTASPNGHPLELIKTLEGQVLGTKLRYLYQCYDTEVKSEMLRLYNVKLPKIKDIRLKERKKGINLTDYIERIYDFTMKP